mmetsp:Transcript_78633/g.202523  ORF Transcript_78633/g.202523 Transcript_78633/m.202523 type:complete len:304 (-) Transcript_78633:1050-1961(-)
MDRLRKRWPPQCEQPLHADHWPQRQSAHSTTSHGCVLHGATSLSVSSQGRPPPEAGSAMCRERVCWPPPHERVHSVHGFQRLMTQFNFGMLPHSIDTGVSTPGLHGSTRWIASVHGWPPPFAKVAMNRFRSRTPKHASLHWLHSPQWAISQSCFSTQGSNSEQTWNSSLRPLAGCPQRFGSTCTSRRRVRKPLEQVAEHAVHSCQSPYWPSMQPSSHDCVLHGAISSVSCGGQALPPFSGTMAMARFLFFPPPPQDVEHADQESQPLHLQSTTAQSWLTHGTTSRRAPSQPLPCSAASCAIFR